ncbi:PLP-dependent cysteine synthase family protein [Nostocaceae cyanobacterium CENA357]|uniref:cysteine synthase n=1 Tax=Atlanticothrix silvestris CENA357 TaxID=1725252 RepID=A0A8J7HM20_9CYAN|nr:PLP-dependent cysteine synthase family protein [Atlanticothrix silvestris]MBH8554955.1 PLP-dependent cysteine synthase family protein [Atlanticothrix silvestris CENA357]
MIYNSILETVGNTPIVKLNKATFGTNSSIFVKLETFNPGGSHKIRIAFNMIRSAERMEILKPNSGQTILEPTGGNTGIGIAIAASVLGYKVVLVIPDNYATEKQKLLKAFGVEVVLSDSRNGNNSHGELAQEIQLEHPDYVMLNQSQNPANPETHRLTTAKEILADFKDEKIDYFVASIGTGGHITGIGEVLKKELPNIVIAGVQPKGCDLLCNKFIPHKIQGLAVGMIPKVLNIDIVDKMISIEFDEAVMMMKNLMKKEGLLVGISSGANIAAALKIAQEDTRKINILTLAYDSAADYLDVLD